MKIFIIATLFVLLSGFSKAFLVAAAAVIIYNIFFKE